MPPHVAAYFASLPKAKADGVARIADSIAQTQRRVANSSGKAKQDATASLKRLQNSLDAAKKSDGSQFARLKTSDPGSIGILGEVEIFKIIDAQSALIELRSSRLPTGVARPGVERRPIDSIVYMILRGVDTSKFTAGQKVNLNMTLEATGFDDTTLTQRCMVIVPFDAAKWRKPDNAKK